MGQGGSVPECFKQLPHKGHCPGLQVRPAEISARLYHRNGSHGIESAQNLVIPRGLATHQSRRQQLRLNCIYSVMVLPDKVIKPLEVTRAANLINPAEFLQLLRRQQCGKLIHAPQVGSSLLMVCVGIKGRDIHPVMQEGLVKTLDYLLRHRPVVLPARNPVSQGVAPQRHRLVIKHLLEMRNGPFAVHAVAINTSLQMIIQSPHHHCVKGGSDHLLQRFIR